MNELDLFAAAIAIADPVERVALLDRECAERPGLRSRLDHLIDAHFHSNALLDSPTADHAAVNGDAGATADYASPVQAGSLVAVRYKLLQPIGEGGMGTVWMADQTEPVKRRVAVKLIRVERGQSKTVLSRFEAERQAIALMDHPNIAKLLDAGATEDGSPFFVMELVKGTPLTDYCDAHRLGIPERLRLFQQVCSAVQHAHQKGVIHRDLKPTNILVEDHDGKPVPKVIDFGLAKATTGLQLTDNTLFTAFGSVMGTPLYMAPEQANFSAVDVDTRADVYALGVILYELLTGTTPLTRESIKKAQLDEMLRLIREQDAPTPSSRLSTLDSAPSVAANRQSEPAKLGRIVKGELDWIVLKALSKERDRRYETANGFARDVERYLNREPVTAGPPTAGYKLKKFVQRNRGQVIAAGLVLATLLVGIAGTTWGLMRAEQRRVEAEGAKDRESAQRRKAEAAYQKTADVLDAMTSDATGDSLSTQKEISAEQKKFLTEALTYYREFAGEKADDEQSRYRQTCAAFRVGKIEYRLGNFDESARAYGMGHTLLASLAADYPTVANYRVDLAGSRFNLGQAFKNLGKRAEAEAEYRSALAIEERLAADFPAEPKLRQRLSEGHMALALLQRELGKREAAEEQVRKAMTILEKLAADFPNTPNHRMGLAHCHFSLGNLFRDLGQRTEAEAEYRKSLAIEVRLNADFPAAPGIRQGLAASHYTLGSLLRDLGKLEEAESQFRMALTIREKLAEAFPSAPEHRKELATTCNGLGVLLRDRGKRTESEVEHRKALAIQEKLAADFPNVPAYQVELGNGYFNRGVRLQDDGRLAESAHWYDSAIGKLQSVYEKDPRDATAKRHLCYSHGNRARARLGLKRPLESVKDWERAIELGLPIERPLFRTQRAISLLQAGLVDEAVAEVDELTKTSKFNAGQWYDFACIYAVASVKVADKKQEYADRAMELLNQTVQAGYKNAALMKKDSDLDVLRDRADFKKLLADLEKTASNPAAPKK